MSYSDSLKQDARPVWNAILEHPMVKGIGDGSLDEAPFRYWVKQDYVYLIEYCRMFALAAAKAPDLEKMGRFATLLHETLHTEMDLHREYARSFDLSPQDLEDTKPSPTTQGYTDFLVRTASMGDHGDIMAALLPCMWGFNDTGLHLQKKGLPEHEGYRQWIEMYASQEFTDLTNDCRALMDEAGHGARAEDRERHKDIFITSARYELLFWDAAWKQEEWPA
jgi:thiaminase (transcriptional activator TenA)